MLEEMKIRGWKRAATYLGMIVVSWTFILGVIWLTAFLLGQA